MEWIEVDKPMQITKGYIWVACIAEIRCNKTNEVREYETDEMLEGGQKHPSVFNWEENNNSCDCNRLLYFKRVNNEETDEDWDVDCTDGKYSVNLKNKANGEVYYREYES